MTAQIEGSGSRAHARASGGGSTALRADGSADAGFVGRDIAERERRRAADIHGRAMVRSLRKAETEVASTKENGSKGA